MSDVIKCDLCKDILNEGTICYAVDPVIVKSWEGLDSDNIHKKVYFIEEPDDCPEIYIICKSCYKRTILKAKP